MSRPEEATERFQTSMNCAQSVLATYCEDLGLDVDTAITLTAPFGGGMSRREQACGAITGGLMVIGLRFGTTDTDDKEMKAEVLMRSQRFLDLFKARNGGLRCDELLGVDIGTREGQMLARKEDLFKRVCPNFVKEACEVLEMVLKE